MKRLYLAVAVLLGFTSAAAYINSSNLSLLRELGFTLPAKAGPGGSPTSGSSPPARREPLEKVPDSNRIDGQIVPSSPTDLREGSPTSDDVTANAVARPATGVATFNTTILRRPFKVRIYDGAFQDGDIVRVTFNGRTINPALLITNAGQTFEFSEAQGLKRGVNLLEIAAINEGSEPPNTPSIEYSADQTLNGQLLKQTLGLNPGQSFVTTVGFPQIAICRTRVRFPCLTRPFPESSQHVLEAIGNPPEPIRAALKPRATGNPLRGRYPRLLTIDRDNGTTRRNRSTAPYAACPRRNGQRQQLDEYPPAVFLENLGSAHIKCILGSDNQGAGSTFGFQLRAYAEVLGNPVYRLDGGVTIEFIVLD